MADEQQNLASGLLSTGRGPWTGGYTSAVQPFFAKPNQLVGAQDGTDNASSRDCIIDPATGGVSKRLGCSILNDTVTGSGEVSGILNTKSSMTARKVFAIDSPSLADGYPTVAALFGNDDSKRGTVYLSSTNAGATTNALKNYSLLEEFSNGNTYSNNPGTKTASSDYRLKVVPMFFDSGSGLYNRGALTGTASNDQFLQQFLAPGSRSVLNTQNWLYAPNLYGSPWRWNKRFNESGTVGSETVRIFPTGPLPPLFCPTAAAGAASATNSSWVDGDTFFVSVIFQFEDGSYSAPCIPRMPNATLTSGLGLVTVGTAGGANKYQYVRYSNIAIGPEGTVARIILRTPKQGRTSTSDSITVAPLDLRIVGVLRNNTQKEYDDYAGDDNSLLEDNNVVRVDYTMPRRARYIGTGDQRAIVSYTLPNPSAIILAPVGKTTTYDLNVADTGAAYSTTGFYLRITTTQLELHATTSGAKVAGTNFTAFTFSTYPTLQELVDAINNSTVVIYGCKQWRAQLCPGVDGTMASSSLAPTYRQVANCSAAGSTTMTTTSTFENVPVGAQLEAPGIAAGTYVVSKESNTSLTMSNSYTLGPIAVGFYSNTGDEGYADTVAGVSSSFGYIRAFCPAFPVVAFVVTSAFPKYDTPDKTSVYFTVASPGAASSGVSLAPNSWVAGNRRMPHASPRPVYQRSCVGIVDIEGASIIAYSDGIHMLANVRGANTGEDEDTRLFTVNDTRGCISYRGITAGNGWAAYATLDGIIVTDKNRREFKLSADLFNTTDNTGDLAYEVGKSAASVSKDTDDQYLVLGVVGTKLAVACRYIDDDANVNGKVIFYDFSPGIEASGIEELISPETREHYIWSPPFRYNSGFWPSSGLLPSAFGSCQGSEMRHYLAYDTNLGTKDGHIEWIERPGVYSDNDSPYEAVAIMAPFVASDFNLLQPQSAEITHVTKHGTGTDTYVSFCNNQNLLFPASLPLIRKLPVDTATKPLVNKQVVPIDTTQRGSADMVWARWESSTSAGANKLWRLVLRYSEVQNSNSRIAGS